MNDSALLSGVAKLFGRLLVREIDGALAAELSTPEIASALRGMGLEVPGFTRDVLDDLAADYFEFMVKPNDQAPLLQSLFEDGRYQSAVTVSIERIADSAGVELDRELARGAPVDHLGVELLLWAELATRSSSVAHEFAERHLAWSLKPLQAAALTGGFYGRLASTTAQFIDSVMRGKVTESSL